MIEDNNFREKGCGYIFKITTAKTCQNQINTTNSSTTTSLASRTTKTPFLLNQYSRHANYWPIENDLKDNLGSSDLIPANISAVIYGSNYYNETNRSIYLNNHYYSLKPDVYFDGGRFLLVVRCLYSLNNGPLRAINK